MGRLQRPGSAAVPAGLSQHRAGYQAQIPTAALDRVLLTLGGRHQTIENRGYDYNTGVRTSAYKESRISPVAGLVFKATPAVSLYANHIEGLVNGDIAPAFNGTTPVTNAGESFAPYVSKQKEIGVERSLYGEPPAQSSRGTTSLTTCSTRI